MPIDFVEAATASAACKLLRAGTEIVLVDGDLSSLAELIEVSRGLKPAPMILSFASRRAAGRIDGFGGTLQRPSDADAARVAVNRCIKASMPMQAMIIDDSSTMRAIVRKILEGSRFKLIVTDASEGSAALAAIGKGAVDIIFLDYNMPGLNGIDTLSQIKRDKPDVAVVMMTSTLDPSLAKRAKSSGAAGFLKKPFFSKDVDAVLARYHGLQE